MVAATYDQSRKDAQTVELYYFEYGDGPSDFEAYCNTTEVVSFDGVDYQPLAITFDKSITAPGTLDKSQMAVKVPMDCAIAILFAAFPPARAVILTIRQGDYADPDADFPVMWVGRVMQSSRGSDGSPSQAILSCEPSSTSLRRVGLRRAYQLTCPHVLYQGRCGASRAAATVSVLVDSVSGNTVTLPAAWFGSFDPEKFISGTLRYDGLYGTETLTIVGKSDDDLTLRLSRPLNGLAPSDSVEVTLGCNRTMGDCADLHGAINDYGGQPWIPTQNPVKTNTFTQ